MMAVKRTEDEFEIIYLYVVLNDKHDTMYCITVITLTKEYALQYGLSNLTIHIMFL